MATPTLTKRMIKNQATGIDLSVPSIQEVEAPLGGISVEYEIAAVTNLQIFKTQLHKSEDVVHFSVFKAYREVEDLYNKLHKKFPSLNLPSIPKGNIILTSSNVEKQKSLDSFMKFVAQNDDICQSSYFIQFIGINPQKYHRSSITDNCSNKEQAIYNEEEKLLKNNSQDAKNHQTSLSLKEELLEEKETMSLNSENNTPDDMFAETEVNIKQDIIEEKEVDFTTDIFPKMKVKAQNQQLQNDDNLSSSSYSSPRKHNGDEDDVDLFEEVKLSKENKNKETQLFDSERKSHHGLFDEVDDGSSNLFASNKTTSINENAYNNSLATPKHLFSTKAAKSKLSAADGAQENINELPSSMEVLVRQPSKPLKSDDDTKVILQDRMPGEVSLFKEQDYGESITTDEESLFLVSQNEQKQTNKNPLLASSVFVADSKIETKAEIEEDLEDLLKLDPLPKVPVALVESVEPLILDHQRKNEKLELSSEPTIDYKQSSEKQEQILKQTSDCKQVKDNQEITSKPVPDYKNKPRKQELSSKPVPKPRSKIAPVVPANERPEVLPRKVFLSKPALPPKPAPPASKPAPPTKPKPPARKFVVAPQKLSDILPKPDDKSSQEPTDGLFAENQRSADDQPGDLNSLDILQYIEQEEKLFSSEPSLFD